MFVSPNGVMYLTLLFLCIILQYNNIRSFSENICKSVRNRPEKRVVVELFWPVSQRMQINIIFINNVRKLC
jgi:hypothetical protein